MRAHTPPEHVETTYTYIWDYSKLNVSLITTLLQNTDWTHILNNDVDTATELFVAEINNAAVASIPIKRKAKPSRQKPWVTSELKRHIRKRDRLFKIAKQNQTDFNWQRWRYQRNLVTTMNRQLKDEHIQNQVQKLATEKRHPYKYHKTLRTLIGRSRSDTIPPIQTEDGDIIIDDDEKATLFNNYFATQSTLVIPDDYEPPTSTSKTSLVPELESICTTEQEVLRILNSLDPNKSTGPDGLPVKLLKLIAILISEPLAKLFNKSLATGKFPEKFKEALVKPVFKNKGSPSNYSSYRPISILSAISKVFEKIVYKKVYNHLTENSLLSDKQSGYRQRHSTQQQLLYLTHNLYKSLDSGRDFTAIYLDISKYFDKIWHKGLLYKCKHDFGISGPLLDWFASYLKDRRQQVRIRDTISTTQIINAGCPQGSVLGPLLALLYLDGLSTRTKNDILFFADDTSLYASHGTTDMLTTQQTLQEDLDAIYDYGREWAITFNTTKTIQQTFSHKQDHIPPKLTFGGDPIPIHEKHTHLGLTLSKDLHFHQHINVICHKVNKTLGPLYIISKHIPRETLDQIYKTYIRPHFDYCDVIYDGHITIKDATRLETLQNRIARLVTGGRYRTPTSKLLSELGWDRLTRRHYHRLILYHKLDDPRQHCPNYIMELMPNTRAQDTNRRLRNANMHTIASSRTTTYHKSFFPQTSEQWNKLPNTVRTLKHDAFKKQIHEQLGASEPPTYYTFGTKLGNVLHARLRMDMSELNSHLYSIQKIASPACHCGYNNETVSHFILKCPNYVKQRDNLFKNISESIPDFGIKPPNYQLQTLIYGKNTGGCGGRLIASHFQVFLFNTKRFI